MDWLGAGIYFWEYAPYRALEWARARHSEPAVLEAVIHLGDCLNLLDRQHFEGLAGVYEELARKLKDQNVAIPQNTRTGAHFLDREIVDTYCELAREVGPPFQTVRGCFPEGEAVYPGSKILSKAHVQIAVRQPSCIGSLRQVNLDGRLTNE